MAPEPHDEPPSPRVIGLAWAFVLAAVLWHGLHPLSDLDLWWHIKLGELIWTTGSLVDAEPFSHTVAGAAWTYKDAGFAVGAYALWSLGGATLLVITKAVAFGGLAWLLWRLLRHARSLPPSLATIAVALALDGTAYRFTERAASLSLLILVALLLLIERDRQGRPGLWWAIGLTALNANLHRAAILLPVIVGAYAVVCLAEALAKRESHASQRVKRNALIAIGCGLACLATPFTTAIFSTSSTLVDEHTAMLTEWAPVSAELVFALSPASALVLLVVVAAAIVLVIRVRPLPWWDLALIAMALALGLRAMRHLPYLALLGIGPAARAFAPWTGWIRRVGGLLAIAAGTALFASAISRPLATPGLGLAPAHYPERGVAYVQGLPTGRRIVGNMLNEFGYGGYLIFHLWPDDRVFVDGRTDLVYPAPLIAAHADALASPEGLAAATQSHTLEWIFVDNAPHLRQRAHLDANPAWTLVHASRRALIYVRTQGPNASLANAQGYRWLWAHDLLGSFGRAAAAGHGDAAIEELRRMVADDPDNLYAVQALLQISERLGLAGP